MLGLPQSTELKKLLPKSAIYKKFDMNNAAKEKFDADISRIDIVGEISTATTAIAPGKKVRSFFVLNVALKRSNFDEKSIALISKLINQNLLFVLEFSGKSKLAVFHSKLMQTEWKPSSEWALPLRGLDMDAVWQSVITLVGSIKIEQGNTLDEQIAADTERQRNEKQIACIEKLARAEKQPKKKFELVKEIKRLKGLKGL